MDINIKTSKNRGGKKSRKHGRMGRKPAQKRYNAEKRWEKNKKRKAAKLKKVLERKKARKER